MNFLVKTIKELINKQLETTSLIVWYDKGGSLGSIIPIAIPSDVEFITYRGRLFTNAKYAWSLNCSPPQRNGSCIFRRRGSNQVGF